MTGIKDPFAKSAESFEAEWLLQTEVQRDRLLADLPELPKDAKVLGMGAHGITIDHGDGSVSKIFLKGGDPDFGFQLFARESMILTLLQGQTYGTARTPSITHVTPLDFSKEAVGSVRMEKFEGVPPALDCSPADEQKQTDESHYRNIGHVLADLHLKAHDKLKDIRPLPKVLGHCDKIAQIPSLGEDINHALQLYDNELRKQLQPGVCHGDFHPKNFKTNEGNQIIGLFDLSFAGRYANRCVDFVNIPDKFLPYVLDEYEKRTGVPTDPRQVMLTKLSQTVGIINYQLGQENPNQEFLRIHVASLAQTLNSLSKSGEKLLDISHVDSAALTDSHGRTQFGLTP